MAERDRSFQRLNERIRLVTAAAGMNHWQMETEFSAIYGDTIPI